MKEYTWDVDLGGTVHHILAVKDKQGSGYHLYDGDDHITNILPASFKGAKMGIEQEFEVDGHKMRFCQWEANSPPDIEKDGHMLWENISYAKAKDKILVWNLVSDGAVLAFLLLYLPVGTLITGDPPDIGQYLAVLIFVVYYVYKIIKKAKLRLDLKSMKVTDDK